MRLVKLDDDVWVNPEHVSAVEARDGKTYVYLIDGEKSTIDIEVDVYEVLDRLDPGRQQRRDDAKWAKYVRQVLDEAAQKAAQNAGGAAS